MIYRSVINDAEQISWKLELNCQHFMFHEASTSVIFVFY